MQKVLLYIFFISSTFVMQLESCQSIDYQMILQEYHFFGRTETQKTKPYLDEEQGDIRFYFNPESMIIQDNKLYLEVSDYCLPLNNICSDSSGYYVNLCAEGWIHWTCCGCKTLNSYQWNNCSRCHQRRCGV